MLYAENIGLRDCSGFLQIGSQIVSFLMELSIDDETLTLCVNKAGFGKAGHTLAITGI